jgi:hypothetical protein
MIVPEGLGAFMKKQVRFTFIRPSLLNDFIISFEFAYSASSSTTSTTTTPRIRNSSLFSIHNSGTTLYLPNPQIERTCLSNYNSIPNNGVSRSLKLRVAE